MLAALIEKNYKWYQQLFSACFIRFFLVSELKNVGQPEAVFDAGYRDPSVGLVPWAGVPGLSGKAFKS